MGTQTNPLPPDAITAQPRRQIRRKRPRQWMATLLLFMLMIVAVAGYYYRGQDEKPVSDITTATIQQGDIEVTVTSLGNLQPRDYVNVGAQVSGQLEKLHVEIGDAVEEGDLLAEIDPKVLLSRVEASRAQLQAQKAQLAERQAELELAEQQFRRQENLLSEDATSQDAYQISLAAVKIKQAQIA